MNNTTATTLFDRFFRDDKGDIVIAQPPNLPILTSFAATALYLFSTNSALEHLFGAIAFGTFFTWSWLELFQGVNYFRRTLGLLGLLSAIASQVYGFNLL